ncbi:hypothetical protein, partial [Vallitalea sp.]|uniref:hypothetical protein n=1 Tax=Vallitalea sp. TaxID=1882829 RepID=UPI0025E9C97E
MNASGDTAYYVYDTEGNRARKVIERGNIIEERFYLGDYEIYRTFTNETLNLERSTVHIMDDRDRIAMIDRETGGDTVI